MIPVPTGVRVWLATGATDMRRGMNGLALQVQEGLGRDPHAGDLYVFRGKRGDLIKVLCVTALACRSMPSGWRLAALSGHHPQTGSCRLPRPSSAMCWKGSTGGIRRERIGLKRPDNSTQARPIMVESVCEPARSPRIG
jgi:hypothetical protein